MSTVTTTSRGTASVQASVNPVVYNVNVALADTEVSQALTPGTRKFLIRARGNSRVKLAYASGDSGLVYLTIPPGATYLEDGLNFVGSLYFQTSLAPEVIEIVEWT